MRGVGKQILSVLKRFQNVFIFSTIVVTDKIFLPILHRLEQTLPAFFIAYIYLLCCYYFINKQSWITASSCATRHFYCMLTYHQGQKKLNTLPSGFLLFVEYATLNRKKYVLLFIQNAYTNPPPPIQSCIVR